MQMRGPAGGGAGEARVRSRGGATATEENAAEVVLSARESGDSSPAGPLRARHVELRLPAGSARRWHLDLAERLASLPGVSASVALGAAGPPTRDAFDRVLRAERLVHRVRPRLAAEASAGDVACWHLPEPAPDLVIDLEGGPDDDPEAWRLTFDGLSGTPGALAALAEHRFPLIELTRDGTRVAAGRAGSEQPGVLTAALEDVLAGGVLLVEKTVAGTRPAAPAAIAPGRTGGLPTPQRTLLHAGLHRAYRTAFRAPHWRVGWRLLDRMTTPDVVDLLDHPESGWNTLPDDGRHFYADPFPVAVGDHHVLFVEDFDHRLGRGVISAVEFDAHGPLDRPRPVLRHHTHLSYPFVVEDEGVWWMIPETSGAGTVELYRAVDFPDRWQRERVLLHDVTASDVSVVRHGERWWMFATVRHGGSWSDALHLWSADRLTGPWTPHPGNPVLLDIASARPAGRPMWREGRLLRPVQDGSTGYGGALAIAEVTRLDEAGYDQRVVARLGPGRRWPGSRLHTLNRAGRLECIDGSARSPRFWG